MALAEEGIAGMDDFPKEKFTNLNAIIYNFSEEDATWIKDTEKVTNHDVKAVEYFIKDAFEKLGLSQYKEFIHANRFFNRGCRRN